jgi:cytoskeletal protein RodZ
MGNMTPQNDLDETLPPPRFDAAEADAARPVEPLAEVQTGASRARLQSFLHAQRRALRRSWPLALTLCLLTAVVVGGTTALIHRQHTSQQEAAQPNVTPAGASTANTNQPANASAPTRARAARSEPALRRPPSAAQPPVEYVITDDAFAREDRGDERDVDKHERKKEHKHKGHDGAEDEGLSPAPRDKKATKRGGARLVDVITGRDH